MRSWVLYQDGVFGRQALGVEDKRDLFPLSIDQKFHRPGEVPFLGFQADMFQVEQDGGQEFTGKHIGNSRTIGAAGMEERPAEPRRPDREKS